MTMHVDPEVVLPSTAASPTRAPPIRVAVFGLALGFSLSEMGFTDWTEVNRMFTVSDPRLYLVFAGGVALTAAGFVLLGRGRGLPVRRFHRGIVPGAALFGAGWAITGACPAAAAAQLGEGKLIALVTVVGVLLGAAIYPWLHRRFFRWDTGSCET